VGNNNNNNNNNNNVKMILNRRRLEGDKKSSSKIPSGCVNNLQKPEHLLPLHYSTIHIYKDQTINKKRNLKKRLSLSIWLPAGRLYKKIKHGCESIIYISSTAYSWGYVGVGFRIMITSLPLSFHLSFFVFLLSSPSHLVF